MDHREIENDDVVERYLLGQLSGEAKERFEAHYLGCPECLDRLETAEAMIEGAREAAAAGGAASFGVAAPDTAPARSPDPPVVLGSRPPAAVPPPARRRLPFRRSHAYALAALLALALAVPFFTGRNDYGPPAAVLDLERGAEGQASTRLPLPSHGRLVLALQLSPPTAKNYRVELYRLSESQPVWQDDHLDPRQELLHLAIPAGVLPAAEYLLRVQLPDGGGSADVGYYRFAIIAEP
jgi:hypothetical protein